MVLKYLLYYIIGSYIFTFGLVIYLVKQLANMEKNEKKARPYLIVYALMLAFSPVMLPIAIFNYIKDSIKNG